MSLRGKVWTLAAVACAAVWAGVVALAWDALGAGLNVLVAALFGGGAS